MRLFGLPLLMVVGGVTAIGCKMDNPAYGQETEGDGGSGGTDGEGTRGTTTSTAPDTSDTKGSDTQGGTSTTGPDTVTDSGSGTHGGTTTDGGTTDGGTGGSTGGEPLCPLDEPPKIFFKTLQNGSKITTCGGQAISVQGPVAEVAPGQWTVRNCGDSCDAGCQGEEILLEYFGPSVTEPIMPDCAIVQVDQHHAFAVDQCEFSGIVIHEMFNPNAPPVYVAVHDSDYAPTGVSLQVEPDLQPEPVCECVQAGCCDYTPGLYKLWFPTSESSASLKQGGSSLGEFFPGVFGDVPFDLHVVRSHVHDECGAAPHFDWAVTRDPFG